MQKSINRQPPIAKSAPVAVLKAPVMALAPAKPAAAPTPDTLVVSTPPATPAKPAPKAVEAPKSGFFARAKANTLAFVVQRLHALMTRFPGAYTFISNFTGPIVKARFNPPPGKEETTPSPAPFTAAQIEQARQAMAENFKPKEGKVLVAISGTGTETVHCFVVSGVKPNGDVMITQALAQYSDRPEDYSGLGGWIRKQMDKWQGNKPLAMEGVVEESWSSYAARSHRNTLVLMELDADPAKIDEALKQLKGFVGRPYDTAMLANDPASRATEMGMYCTEVSSWFVNKLRPGTIKMSQASGYPVFQVADHMRATEAHDGPLKVLLNVGDRLDVASADPVAKGQ